MKNFCGIITVAVNSAKKRKFDVSALLFREGVVSMTDYELAMLILTIISVIFTILGYFQKK